MISLHGSGSASNDQNPVEKHKAEVHELLPMTNKNTLQGIVKAFTGMTKYTGDITPQTDYVLAKLCDMYLSGCS